MPRITPHPKLKLVKTFSDAAVGAHFAGFAADAPDGVVRLCDDLSGDSYVEFRASDVLTVSQDEETGVTELKVRPDSVLRATAAVVAPVLQLAMLKDDKPDAGVGKTCLEKRVDACKKDPNRSGDYCDSDSFKNLAGVFCKVFGDPPVTAKLFTM